MIEGALVLEGGSLRSLFTDGVLSVLLNNNIEMSYVNGVSAGSMCALNYLSKQAGRTKEVNTRFVNDKKYLGFRNMLHHGGIFNFDYLFDVISKDIIPFDEKAFWASKQRYVCVATDCNTGEPYYFEKEPDMDIKATASASSSMPLLSDIIWINDKPYLDGGVSDPIAYKKAIEEGYEKVVVVLTREKGYRKQPNKKLIERAYDKKYAKYDKLREKLHNIPNHYNAMQEEIDELEKAGKIFIIRPEKPVTISRVEKNVQKLQDLYDEGVKVMEERLPDLKKYLKID